MAFILENLGLDPDLFLFRGFLCHKYFKNCDIICMKFANNSCIMCHKTHFLVHIYPLQVKLNHLSLLFAVHHIYLK